MFPFISVLFWFLVCAVPGPAPAVLADLRVARDVSFGSRRSMWSECAEEPSPCCCSLGEKEEDEGEETARGRLAMGFALFCAVLSPVFFLLGVMARFLARALGVTMPAAV